MAITVQSEGKFERFSIIGHKSESERMWEIVDEMEIQVKHVGPLRLSITKCDINMFHMTGEKELK